MDINKQLELYQFEKLNQALFNNHPDAIYILDLEGNFTMANEVVCQVTGIEREQIIGNSFVPLIRPEDLAMTVERFTLAIQDKPQRYETAIVTQDGIKYIDVTNFPLKVENEIVAIFGIAKDITEQKRKEHELEEYANLLKAQNDELEVFRKIIAHDMRSPVANAIGFARLLEEDKLPTEKVKEVKYLLRKTVESVDTMVRDLNEVIALKSTGREFKTTVVLKDLLRRLVALFSSEIKKINASVTVTIEPDLSISTIKAYLESIIRNLISNALKYHSRSAQVLISVAAVSTEKGIEITVKDNGVGMDMTKISDDIFKMHKRFAPALAEGNGLGLYIVKQQVKLLNGCITVESEPGIGTEFKVFVPR
jgi:PAS domain S-box-containing protein